MSTTEDKSLSGGYIHYWWVPKTDVRGVMQACFRCWRAVEPQTKWLLRAKSATQRKQLPRRPPHRVGEAGMETSSQQSKSCRELMIQEPIVE